MKWFFANFKWGFNFDLANWVRIPRSFANCKHTTHICYDGGVEPEDSDEPFRVKLNYEQVATFDDKTDSSESSFVLGLASEFYLCPFGARYFLLQSLGLKTQFTRDKTQTVGT